MKKLLLLSAIVFGMSTAANAQEWLFSATRKGGPSDGYITAGYIKKGWGIYAGLPYTEIQAAQSNGNIAIPAINTQTGTISGQMKYGILRQVVEGKWMFGAGIQPTANGTKPNVFLMYNPLKASGNLKLWTVGNLVGSDFTLGLGLSLKMGK
jgi:hypothetical protein